ncbi:hypothetical protein C8Q80DRAFT_1111269 [Daedaleopsis nitida]|nr:hypothetical protein C8Q80DRAFT_1111269 [Daedaleopsis nitida]
MFRLSLQEGWPRYRLEVPDGDTVREYLVARPYFRAKGMTGRGTRGYVALECGTGLFRWLKDAWRVDYESVELEGDTLQELNNEGILFVPTLVCHGDILKQKTKTPDYWLRKNSPPPDLTWRPLTASTSSFRTLPSAYDDCPLRMLAHYRVVVKEVCMPLSMFTNGQHLVTVIVDCLTGQ